MFDRKYVKTADKKIIIFPAAFGHDDFRHFNPVSAGFIDISYDPKQEKIIYTCYGESKSLGLKSQEEDSIYAQIQFNAEF